MSGAPATGEYRRSILRGIVAVVPGMVMGSEVKMVLP